jgi:nucleotide-binding universal stress UspA family protein
LASAKDALARERVKAEIAAATGHAASEIVQYADQHQCGLIVMATHGRTGAGAWFLGGVADRVLHTAVVPVLLVNPDAAPASPPIQQLIVALDGSPVAEAALPHVTALAGGLGVEALLLHVVPATSFIAAIGQGRVNDPRLDEFMLSSAGKYLERTGQALAQRQVRSSPHVLSGDPADEILAFAKARKASLLVLSARGQSSEDRWVLGSVTARIVRHMTGAALVVPASQKKG